MATEKPDRSLLSARQRPLHRHRSLLVRAADNCRLLTVTGDDAHSLIELGDDVLGCSGFEKRDAVYPAGGKDAFARLLHLRRVRLARDRHVPEHQSQIAGSQFGEAEPGHCEDLFTFCDTLGTLKLDPEQQFARWVERPGIATREILLR